MFVLSWLVVVRRLWSVVIWWLEWMPLEYWMWVSRVEGMDAEDKGENCKIVDIVRSSRIGILKHGFWESNMLSSSRRGSTAISSPWSINQDYF